MTWFTGDALGAKSARQVEKSAARWSGQTGHDHSPTFMAAYEAALAGQDTVTLPKRIKPGRGRDMQATELAETILEIVHGGQPVFSRSGSMTETSSHSSRSHAGFHAPP